MIVTDHHDVLAAYFDGVLSHREAFMRLVYDFNWARDDALALLA